MTGGRRGRGSLWVAACLSLFVPVQGVHAARSIDLPASIGTLGDSISRGFLASFKRQDAIYPWVQPILISEVFVFLASKQKRVLERPAYNWATGRAPYARDSHEIRLGKLLPRGDRLRSFSFAETGADSRHMLDVQLPELLEESQKKLHQGAPDYVTLLVGSNDVCADRPDLMTETAVFADRVAETIDTVLSRSPRTRLLVTAIPNIALLRANLQDAALFGIGPLGRCRNVWAVEKVCATLTSALSPEDQARVSSRLREYNESLAWIVESRVKMYGDRVRLADATAQIAPQPDEMSVDCFHPNLIGQARLARDAWKSTWWSQVTIQPAITP